MLRIMRGIWTEAVGSFPLAYWNIWWARLDSNQRPTP